MRRSRVTRFLFTVLVLGGSALLLRALVVRRATPELVTRWATAEAARHGVQLVLDGVTSPEPGRLHMASVTATPDGDASPPVSVRAEDVDIVYTLTPLGTRRVHVERVRVERVTIALHPRAVSAAGWEMTTSAAATAELAAAFAGSTVFVRRVALDVYAGTGAPPRRFVGDRWYGNLNTPGDTMDLAATAWAEEGPAVRADVEAHWQHGRGWEVEARGEAEVLANEWDWWREVVPALAAVPMEWSGGRAVWTAGFNPPRQGAWEAQGTFAFSDVQLPPRGSVLAPWEGTGNWALRGGDTLSPSLDLQTNYGDLTLGGVIRRDEHATELDVQVLALGVRGALLADGLASLTERAGGTIQSITAGPDTEATVDLRVQGPAAGLHVRGVVETGGGMFQVEVAPDIPYLQFAELTGRRAQFEYDPASSAIHGQFEVETGMLELGVMDLVGRQVRGTLGFGPDGLKLGPPADDGNVLRTEERGTPIEAVFDGAEVRVWGDLPFRADRPLDLRLEARITDLRAFAGPLQLLPDSLTLELPHDADANARSVHLTASVTGLATAIETTVAVDATPLQFAIGRIANKPAGERAVVAGTFRQQDGGLRGDISVTLTDPVGAQGVRLSGALVATPRAADHTAGTMSHPLDAWDVTFGLASPKLQLDVLRRLSPITRMLGGYGSGAVNFLFKLTEDGPVSEAWLDVEDVTLEFRRLPQTFALGNSVWHATSFAARKVTRLEVTGDTFQILDALAPAGFAAAESSAPLLPVHSPWVTTVVFDFDRAAWGDRVNGENLKGRLSYSADGIILRPLQVQVFDGLLAGQIALDRHDEATVAAQWQDCDVDQVLASQFGTSGAAQGRTYGSCQFSGVRGAWPDWHGEGSVQVHLPAVTARYFTDAETATVPWPILRADFASARFTFAGGEFAVPDLRVDREGIAIRGQGHIDLDGDLRFTCFAYVDNALVEELPLMARAMFTRPVTPDTREVEFTLRHNIRSLQPTVKRSSVGRVLGDLGRGSVTRSGRLLLDLLGL